MAVSRFVEVTDEEINYFQENRHIFQIITYATSVHFVESDDIYQR